MASKMTSQTARYSAQAPATGHSAGQVTCLFLGGQGIYFKQCHLLFNYRHFCGEKKNTAAASKKKHVITIKECVVLYRKVAFKAGKDWILAITHCNYTIYFKHVNMFGSTYMFMSAIGKSSFSFSVNFWWWEFCYLHLNKNKQQV